MANLGSDVLFENHSIKEIQDIEKKLRNDIERKREELRQMVGERYRDLMEAADTITDMKQIAEKVTTSVKSIESRCMKLQNSRLQNGVLFSIEDKVKERRKSKESLYTLASQIKILMDSPTKIWTSIESRNFIHSASLYLLAKHTHSLLLLDLNQSQLFPVINRQWIAVSQFRSVLLKSSQSVLESQEAEPEDLLGPMCCLCLLTDLSLQKVFFEILNIHQKVLKNVFQVEKSAKDQICEFVSIVQMTLKIIYVLFYPRDESFSNKDFETNSLYQTLRKLMSTEEPGPVSLLDLNSSEIFKFLPKTVTDFRLVLSFHLEECGVKFLQSKCNDWLQDVKSNLQSDLGTLLNFVKSVKHLSLIREALFEKLCKIKQWDIICSRLLNQPFSVWDFFLKECFLQRIEDIINEGVLTASELFEKEVEETLHKIGLESTSNKSKLDKILCLYIWSESPQDVVANVAWQPRHHRNYWDSGELSMKSMGFSPKVQSICKDLDQGIQKVIDDFSHFSSLQVHSLNREEDIDVKIEKFMTEVIEESNIINIHIARAVENKFKDLSNFIETHLKYLGSEEDTPEMSNRIVFLGHLCNGLANLCPHINVALSCEKANENAGKSIRVKPAFLQATVKENEKWKVLKSKLLETSASAFRLWSQGQISNLKLTVDSELTTDSAEGLLKILLQWDKIEIQEESEQGKSVNSVLRIPQHLSTPVANALFMFCGQLNIIGGFSINSEIRSSISKQLLETLLDIYKQKIFSKTDFNSRLLQVQSLQLLFDVQFLHSLLTQKDGASGAINDTLQEIVSKATSQIDPFDMDVFSVPLQQNVKKALQKSLSLYGLITSPDQLNYLNSYKSSPGQMDHNVMLLSSSGTRFPLLPLPAKMAASREHLQIEPKESNVKGIQSHNSSPNLVAIDTPSNSLKSTASFYEKVTAMSSSWFGN